MQNSDKEVAVVIPIYKTQITPYEKIALAQCGKILHNHPIIAIIPHGLSMSGFEDLIAFEKVVTFDESFFDSIAGYNHLMLSSVLYSSFLDYKYILIYQMDCFVFKDELIHWCNQGFDYIGAPWIRKQYHKSKLELALINAKDYFIDRANWENNHEPNKYQLKNKVGNGGFSLRRVKAFYDICIAMQPVIKYYLSRHNNNLYNEDVFWSIEVNREKKVLNIPSCDVALKFAFEVPPFKYAELNQTNLPFGCHDWDHYIDFWQPYFILLGYSIT